jgi:MurNAc alpha-1-phosphate uridylyltransferase
MRRPSPRPAAATIRPGPARAMILAAGEGTRMRPLTETTPKALIAVGGRTIVDRTVDRLVEAGVETIVLNLHHLGDQIEAHLGRRGDAEFVFSREPRLLDTGGGVANALEPLGAETFWVVNGDVLWLNGGESALGRMVQAWDDTRMDALVLLHSTVEAYGYSGRGDFFVDPAGLVVRRPENEVSPFLFTGIQILHERSFHGIDAEHFSLNLLYDRAIAEGRLYSVVHDGEWFHIGTPAGLAEAEEFLRVRFSGTRHR